MDIATNIRLPLYIGTYRFLAIQASISPNALRGTRTILKHCQCNLSRLANFSLIQEASCGSLGANKRNGQFDMDLINSNMAHCFSQLQCVWLIENLLLFSKTDISFRRAKSFENVPNGPIQIELLRYL